VANCTHEEVRLIIDTGLTDSNIESLIAFADAEMLARGMTGTAWTTNLKKQVSMLLTASLAAMNDVRSQGKEGFMTTSLSLPKYYRMLAEEHIKRASIPVRITGKVKATPYEHIDEDDRYQEDLR